MAPGEQDVQLDEVDRRLVEALRADGRASVNDLAAQISVSTPGFFVYFNTGLNLPRLVYSADLSDNTADLAVLARLTNLMARVDPLSVSGGGSNVSSSRCAWIASRTVWCSKRLPVSPGMSDCSIAKSMT